MFVSTKPIRTRRRGSQIRPSKLDEAEAQLDSQLNELKHQELQLRKFLEEQKDKRIQETIVENDNLEISQSASNKDISAIEQSMQQLPAGKKEASLFSKSRPNELPESIQNRIYPSKTAQLLESDLSWHHKIDLLSSKGGFEGIPQRDIGIFIHQIPLLARANSVARLEKMLQDAKVPFDTSIVNGLMSGYAQVGSPEDVERLMKLDPSPPTHYTFGHLAKAYFKTKNVDQVGAVLQRMSELELQPTLPIYTTVIQACIQSRQYRRALKIFDNLKYMAVKTQPDVKLYNTMMLAASKEMNVNKVLDLYREMTSRAVDPLVPDAETYNTLVYACTRDEKTHIQAWKFFMEMLDAGLSTGRHTMNALLYMCANTGELFLTRALFKQLCMRPESYPDGFALNCLFTAYAKYTPNTLSTVLESPYGPKIRSKVMIQTSNEAPNLEMMPPMLPLNLLSSELIVAESAALVQFFAEKQPEILFVQNMASASSNSPVLFNFVHLPARLGDFQEYKRRYHEYTFSVAAVKEKSTEEVSKLNQVAIPRDGNVYRQAILAAKDAKDLEFARQVWEERGSWRHTDMFKQLPKEAREKSDIRFARDMVELFAVSGEVENALRIVLSTSKYFRWRRVHLQPLIDICVEHEDFATLKEIHKLLGWYWRREQSLLHEKI